MSFVAPGDPADLAARVRHGLQEVLGSEPAAVGRAPGRVNLIGEHTDYNQGLVLPVALPHATYAAVGVRSDQRVRLASAQQPDDVWEGSLEQVTPGGAATGWAAYAGGVLWALREVGFEVPGVDVYIDGTVPLGAGLSSSAAIECAVAVGVLSATGIPLDDGVRQRVVEACVRAETEVAGAPTGGMDQTVSVLATAGAAVLVDFRDGTRTQVPLDLDGRTLLVTDTRVSHELTDGGYGSRRADCEAAVAVLGVASLREATAEQVAAIEDERVRRRARHVVTEIERVTAAVDALGRRDWDALGPLFAASHVSMRDDFEISTPELDLAVATAVQAGADAARMTGGGFGGSIVAVVPDERLDAVVAAVDNAFAGAGYPAPAHLVATPSQGASREG
jgi:galactokinase